LFNQQSAHASTGGRRRSRGGRPAREPDDAAAGSVGGPTGEGQPLASHPLAQLPREDLDLIVQLVLASGSLKALAASYGVSYPTIRTRLDRVIARLQTVLDGRPVDPLRELLADHVERGSLSAAEAKRILDAADARAEDEPSAGPT
jgi:hypothetical protein